MFQKVLPLIGIFFILNFGGCKKTTRSEAVLQEDTTFDVLSLCRAGVIEYEIKTIKAVGIDPKNRQKVISEVHIKYPVLRCANTKLENSVENYINNFIKELLKDNMNSEDTAKAQTLNSASQAFIRSCKSNIISLRNESPDLDHVWFCDIIGNVEMQSNRYFTIRFKYNSFTGGAHANYGESYRTFDIASGKQLQWGDILNSLSQEKFTKLAELRFKQVNGMAADKKLSEDEGFFFENDAFYLSDNFGLTSDGLVIYYQPYLVAPYSFGATTLQFKYFEIIDFLNPTLFEEPI